jgi:hypothetical protein
MSTKHTAGPHPTQHIALDQFGRLGTVHQHRANQEVDARQKFLHPGRLNAGRPGQLQSNAMRP